MTHLKSAPPRLAGEETAVLLAPLRCGEPFLCKVTVEGAERLQFG